PVGLLGLQELPVLGIDSGATSVRRLQRLQPHAVYEPEREHLTGEPGSVAHVRSWKYRNVRAVHEYPRFPEYPAWFQAVLLAFLHLRSRPSQLPNLSAAGFLLGHPK